jgi:hypothetical protein
MAIKSLLNNEFKPTSATETLEAARRDLYELHHDMRVLSWGCDLLWLGQFDTTIDNEFLSQFPVAVLRALTARTGQLQAAIEEESKGGAQ